MDVVMHDAGVEVSIRKAPSITGSITFTPNAEVDAALSAHINSELDVILALPPEAPPPRRRMEFAEWMSTKEGNFHAKLMAKYVLSADHIDARTATNIQRRLQAQNVDLRGRPPKFDPRKHHWSSRRKVRLYIMNKVIAKGLGIDTSHWPHPLPPQEPPPEPTPLEPKDTYHSLERFEEWSGLKLPRSAWVMYTATERLVLSAKYPDMVTLQDGGITLEGYAELRSAGVV